MSITIKNEVMVQWVVEDPVYPYASTMVIPLDKVKEFDEAALQAQQEEEYTTWLEYLKNLEASNKQG
jgi:hypothetical protein